MKADRWLLPEGVDEVLPPDADRLEQLRRQILDLYASWGYQLVIPPFIEYLESLLVGTGSDLDLKTFKLTDQLTGRLIGIRADMTPQVARIDARGLRDQACARLCYLGTVLHALPDGFTRTRAPVQVGAELYGHAGFESDCEILSLMLETLAVAGVYDVHVDLGHVGVFRALAKQAGIDAAGETALHDALQRKARGEIAEILDASATRQDIADMIVALPELNGDESVLAEARRILAAADQVVLAALDRLQQTASAVKARFPSTPLHVDLAELRGYRYHTGVVFAALVPGHGQEVARGGRYDEIGSAFGRARPATGFSTDLKSLLALAGPCTEEADVAAIRAPWSLDPELSALVATLRSQGERVVYELPGEAGDADSRGRRALAKHAGKWQITENE
ncbi:MAG: ATP phosphoribosyltransferase regulatory subunit [Gammaproteobacteria bacterium]|jgi:ATP phosphoribosyltransferase regulatory subunit|nr:ATP phosphoribosyltransferase regulatory subunit [Gammaproteobacteria bacterium]MDX2460355.1 ATP phosphoribosyltransferase regulatory subunit [Gammaproteobacteria bacterium]